MVSSRWHKVKNDFLGNKTRTVLIVLSIAVGLFAVGMIVSSRTIVSTEMAESYAAANPSSGTVRTLEPFDEDFVRAVRDMEGVEDADARRNLSARVQIGPDEWLNIAIFAIKDFDNLRVNKVLPESGAWPPPDREVLIERAALPVIKAQVGDTILIETPDGMEREMRIAGLTHDPVQAPAQIDNSPYGYITFDTLEWLGEPYGFNELHIIVKNAADKEHAQSVLSEVKDKAERNGLTIPFSFATEPGELPLEEVLQALMLIMGALGLMSLFLSTFLIINTVSALLAQQKRQIGVMKAIGASTGQIMGMYLGMVMTYGCVALVLAIPLSGVGARALSSYLAGWFNLDLTDTRTPPHAIALQIVIGLLVPVLASLYPFIANLRITAAEAMSAYQLGRGRFGAGLIDRLLSGANLWFTRRFLMRPLLLSLRNIFRRKGRLALTLITLTLAGATFVGIFSVRASIDSTMEDLLRMWDFDTMVIFRRPYRTAKIVREAQRVPGVEKTDGWLQLSVRRVRDDGSESKSLVLFAPRAESELVPSPVIVEGRWLSPEDENAAVLDAILLRDEPDIKLGDEVALKIEGRERSFRVVGVSLGLLFPTAYVNYPHIAHLTGNAGLAHAALVRTTRHDNESVDQTTRALEAHFDRVGLHVGGVGTIAQERAEGDAVFGAIIGLLLVMAVLLAIVGGFGLMGMMSINVLERTREIGVLRAIGAPNRGVAWVFIREGISIGVVSWLFGSLFGYPLGRLLSNAVGDAVLQAPLTFSFSMTGVAVWLILIIILSALASALPARNASRLTVREVLAYE
jgi:putative ABC transport system permease protein